MLLSKMGGRKKDLGILACFSARGETGGLEAGLKWGLYS